MKKCHKTTKFLHFYGLCCGLHILLRIVIPVCPLMGFGVDPLQKILKQIELTQNDLLKCLDYWLHASETFGTLKKFCYTLDTSNTSLLSLLNDLSYYNLSPKSPNISNFFSPSLAHYEPTLIANWVFQKWKITNQTKFHTKLGNLG